MSVPVLLRWRGGELAPEEACETAEPQLLAADSWLVVDGEALRLSRHRARFVDGAAHTPRSALAAFWEAAIAAIPLQGAWFPRVEIAIVRGAPRLSLRLRPAPPLRQSAVLSTWAGRDPRTVPTIKGPDLAALTRIRASVQPLGADEAVILDRGAVAEGALSAILWWRGDVLHTPPAALPRIASVTAGAVLDLAAERGVEVREEATAPGGLAGAEVWSCSALHGIRLATGWVGGPELLVDSDRRDLWAGELAARRTPIGTA